MWGVVNTVKGVADGDKGESDQDKRSGHKVSGESRYRVWEEIHDENRTNLSSSSLVSNLKVDALLDFGEKWTIVKDLEENEEN